MTACYVQTYERKNVCFVSMIFLREVLKRGVLFFVCQKSCVCVWISSNVRARERAEKEHSMKLIRVLRNKRCLLPWLFSQWTKVATGKRLYSFDDVNACENEITKTLCAKFTQLTCQQQWQIAYTTIIPATAGAAASSGTSKNTHLHTHTHRIAWITSHNPNKYGWNLY